MVPSVFRQSPQAQMGSDPLTMQSPDTSEPTAAPTQQELRASSVGATPQAASTPAVTARLEAPQSASAHAASAHAATAHAATRQSAGGDGAPAPSPSPSAVTADSPKAEPAEAVPPPEPEPWIDQVLESTPQAPLDTDEWVDQVLEPSKRPAYKRPPRPRADAGQLPKGAAAKSPLPRASASGASAAILTGPKGSRTITAANDTVAAASAGATRWWLVIPVCLLLAVVLFFNRPGRGHAPVPVGALGIWTTSFWLYDGQKLEILPDTVVATLDAGEEGRYPITEVESTTLETGKRVKISYRLPAGDEKSLEFLAEGDPTTTLRFRAHSGLIWTRPQR